MARKFAYEIGKEEIIIESGLDGTTFHSMWCLYSNYSHSEQIEAMQLEGYIIDETNMAYMIYGTYRLCFMLNCYQLIKTTERFEKAKELFNKQSIPFKTVINFYYRLILSLKME